MQATCALYNIPVIDTPFEARCRASSSVHPCKSLTTRALAAKERIRSSPLSCSVFQFILLSKIETMPLTSSPPLDVYLHSTRQATSRTAACIEYVRLRSEPYRTKRRTMRGVSFLNVATMESTLICMAGIHIVGRRIYNSRPKLYPAINLTGSDLSYLLCRLSTYHSALSPSSFTSRTVRPSDTVIVLSHCRMLPKAPEKTRSEASWPMH